MLMPTRVTDTTFGHGSHGLECCGHSFSGIHITGDFTTYIENLPVARITDTGFHFCPHCATNMNISGSMTTYYANLPSHCLTDTVTEFCGMGNSITSCLTVLDG